mgnify:CR=1 FL=1
MGVKGERQKQRYEGARWDISDGGTVWVGGTHSVAFHSGETRSPREATSALWREIGLG